MSYSTINWPGSRKTTALAIYTCSVWESSHTAALVIHTLEYFSWKHVHFLSMFYVIPHTLAVASLVPRLSRDKARLLQCSSYHHNSTHAQLSFRGGGVLAMNNVILKKWHIAPSVKHRSAWESLKNSSSSRIMISIGFNTKWFMLFFRVWIVKIAYSRCHANVVNKRKKEQVCLWRKICSYSASGRYNACYILI